MIDKPNPRRRWLQFSLRTMFVVVTVFCVVLGTIGVQIKKARDRRQAVAAIRELGGAIAFQHQLDRTEPPGPEWFRQVAFVQLHGPRVNDASLAAIKPFTELKSLTLVATKITDDGLVHLKGLTNLQLLDLRSTKITDDGLNHMKGLTNLSWIDLRGTQVTTYGVKKLQQALPNCDITYIPQ